MGMLAVTGTMMQHVGKGLGEGVGGLCNAHVAAQMCRYSPDD